MKFKFWGVRGSIPTPGPGTVKYGGNTTCIEVRTDNNELIILDAGTGIHMLGQSLLPQMPLLTNIFITHTHWDHIHGLPFFTPIFIPGNHLRIFGGLDPVTGQGIERALNVQLQYSYFPIREAELNAKIEYQTIKPKQVTELTDSTVTPYLLNHPVLNFGYRIECNGKSLYFTGDYEPSFNIYEPDDEAYEHYQEVVEAKKQEVIASMRNVDVLIVDSSYTSAEYAKKKGWGHSTYDMAVEIARKANVKKLFFTHHEPTRTDAQLETIFADIQTRYPDLDFEIELAREGTDWLEL